MFTRSSRMNSTTSLCSTGEKMEGSEELEGDLRYNSVKVNNVSEGVTDVNANHDDRRSSGNNEQAIEDMRVKLAFLLTARPRLSIILKLISHPRPKFSQIDLQKF